MISPCAWNACNQRHLSYPSNECKYDPTVTNCLQIKHLGSRLRQASVYSGYFMPCMKSDSCLLMWAGDWDREVREHMHVCDAACFWHTTWSCMLMLSERRGSINNHRKLSTFLKAALLMSCLCGATYWSPRAFSLPVNQPVCSAEWERPTEPCWSPAQLRLPTATHIHTLSVLGWAFYME